MRDAVEQALHSIGDKMESYAKANCPVDTGNLRNSITHTVDEANQTVSVGTDVEYAA